MSIIERAYFAAVGLLALWVGVWAFFIPERVQKAIPFTAPPLHARFLGAVYLSGLTIMVGSMLARRWEDLRPVPLMVAIWTGGLGLISLLHLGSFPSSEIQTWVWFGAYLAYPLIGLWLAWRHRGLPEPSGGATLPRWARGYLLAQGVLLTASSVLLLLLPGVMAGVWPWPITRMLAQIYSAPLLSYGVGSLLLARRRAWSEIRVPVLGMLVFAVAVLAASVVHRDLFAPSELPDLVWFVLSLVVAVVLALLSVRSVARVPRVPSAS